MEKVRENMKKKNGNQIVAAAVDAVYMHNGTTHEQNERNPTQKKQKQMPELVPSICTTAQPTVRITSAHHCYLFSFVYCFFGGVF